jgi:hypothetical protein
MMSKLSWSIYGLYPFLSSLTNRQSQDFLLGKIALDVTFSIYDILLTLPTYQEK